MFLNILLLSITTILLYFGYIYKSFIMFIFTMIFDDLYYYFYKYKSHRMTFDEKREVYKMTFFIEDAEYKLVIPIEEMMENKQKILAISESQNKTENILKVMGPNYNFFGFKLTPKNIGMKQVSIWKDKKKFTFKDNELIILE